MSRNTHYNSKLQAVSILSSLAEPLESLANANQFLLQTGKAFGKAGVCKELTERVKEWMYDNTSAKSCSLKSYWY